MTLIAEDLLLLLLDNETGKITASGYLDPLLGGALLADLAAQGLVEVRKPDRRWTSSKVHPVATTRRPADQMLVEAMAMVTEKPRSAHSLVSRLSKNRKDQVLDRLVKRGLVRREEHLVLGLFSRPRWPAADATQELQLRQELRSVLVDGAEPSPRVAAIVGGLHAIGKAHKIIADDRVAARAVKKRAKRVAEGDWAAGAVNDAIVATNAAMVAAVVAAASASGG